MKYSTVGTEGQLVSKTDRKKKKIEHFLFIFKGLITNRIFNSVFKALPKLLSLLVITGKNDQTEQ
jgi:hypothetical protein